MEDLHLFTATRLREGYAKRDFAVAEVALAFIRRVQAQEKNVKSFLFFDADSVRTQAEKLDSNISSLPNRPLFGVPVVVKDNISTAKIPTTCGSRILDGYVPQYDATVISKLRDAGAILLGKTNLDEFAMGSSTENSAFGPTKNPWDPTRVPGGSSGGSAAAVASRMSVLGLGSDTGGSIRQPASFTGVLGLKCTYGLVSRFGLVAFASSLDQIGPIGHSVEDLALCLEAITGHDNRDSTSLPDPKGNKYLGTLLPSLKGLRAALPREFFGEGIDPLVSNAVYEAARTLEKLGVFVEDCSLKHIPYSLPAYYIIAPAEASSNLARFDGVRYGPQKSGNDIMEMYSSTRGAGFGAEVQRRILLGTFVLSSGYYDAYYLKAMKVRKLVTNEFEEAFRKYDFLITPTTPTTAFPIGEKVNNPLEMYRQDICTIAANLAGIPALSVPCGQIHGLPIGVQLIGPRFGERTLLSAAREYLAETGFHHDLPGKEAK